MWEQVFEFLLQVLAWHKDKHSKYRHVCKVQNSYKMYSKSEKVDTHEHGLPHMEKYPSGAGSGPREEGGGRERGHLCGTETELLP